MKTVFKDDRGMTLLELMTALALFSVILVASALLLLFCVRMGNLVAVEAQVNAQMNALLNRFETLFLQATAVEGSSREIRLQIGGETQVLLWEETTGTLSLSTPSAVEVLAESVSDWHWEPIPGQPRLIRVHGCIGANHTFTKVFMLPDVPVNKQTVHRGEAG